ncbi:ABC transporter permease [Brachybacterium sp. YJGR34]|uniref:ABC transporter permease n=1 Tax=Brachybacterium sp. YJGR34 TaxID=2059911 RepID=UPI000E0CB746|nr:ABC transporter permease [Brachybacterium sp. YJGR34]
MRPDIDLRGFLDTRGTAILLSLSLLALVGTAALVGLVQPALFPERTSDIELTGAMLTLPLSLIIPLTTILITAGEFSDRSLQNTLLQRPDRMAVLSSKIIAATAVFVVTVVVAYAAAALFTWIGGEQIGDGAIFSSMDSVMTTQLSVLVATLLFSLAMGLLTQSTVIGLVAAIGIPFVVTTAAALSMAFGSETVTNIVAAVDLQTAAMAVADGRGEAVDLLPLLLLVLLPAALGIWRWQRREVG